MNIPKGKIPNALTSIDDVHVVTTADEIFDETQQERQDAINARVIASEASLVAQGGYYECATAGSDGAKRVAAENFSLPASGGSMKIKMVHTNTAASGVTLDINGTGAKPLFYDGVRASAANSWEAGEVIEVYYDPAGDGNNGVYMASNVTGSYKTILASEMDEVLGGEVAVYLTDANGNAVLDDNGKPIEII